MTDPTLSVPSSAASMQEQERQLRLQIVEQQHADQTEAMRVANRPGYQTTEFWLAIIVAVGGELSAAYSTQPWAQIVGHVAAALAAIGYGFARSKVKAAP